MIKFIWHPFDPDKGYHQKRPPIRKLVIVEIQSHDEWSPNSYAVGYRKDHAGDKSAPYFVIPGIGERLGQAVAWCDCLPPGVPMWKMVTT